MKFLSRPAIFAILCLTLTTSALADGEPTLTFHKLISRYIDEARRNYGSTNGLLASDLLLLASNDAAQNVTTNEQGGVVANIKELLAIYPKLPSENQRYLAVQALNLGHRLIDYKFFTLAKLRSPNYGSWCGNARPAEDAVPPPFMDPILGGKIIACVVEAAAKNHWPSNKSLEQALAKVATDENVAPDVRAQAKTALSSQEASQETAIEPIVADLEAIIKADWPPNQKREITVDWARYQPSCLKGLPEQPEDTPPEKRRVTFCKSMTIHTFPRDVSHKIQNDLDVLIKLYPTLSEADQSGFSARIMDLTGKLLRTDENRKADVLFWKIFESVKIGWLDNGQIAGGLLDNNTYYFQSYDMQNAKKIITKVVAFESAGNPNFASEINRRTVLAETCDMMGERDEAKKQYRIVNQLNEKMFADGFSSPDFYKNNKEGVETCLRALH